jgi:hypothetical protein
MYLCESAGSQSNKIGKLDSVHSGPAFVRRNFRWNKRDSDELLLCKGASTLHVLVLVLVRLVLVRRLVWLLLVLVNLRPHYFCWCTDNKRSLTNQWLVRRVLRVSWLVISSTLLASIASHTSTSTSNVDAPLEFALLSRVVLTVM